MSSRVRLMLQDLMNGTAYTGKSAYAHLQNLYQNWEKGALAGKVKTQETWVQCSNAYAAEHPFSTTMWYHPATAEETPRPMQWIGPGFYQVKLVAVPVGKPKVVPPLPPGARWQVALEMWSRLQETCADSYRLFCSRDNRKHAWRKSLCNPFYQQFGWKARKPAAKKVKKPNGRSPLIVPDGYWDARGAGENQLETRVFRAGGAQNTPKQAPVKPRVGIWS